MAAYDGDAEVQSAGCNLVQVLAFDEENRGALIRCGAAAAVARSIQTFPDEKGIAVHCCGALFFLSFDMEFAIANAQSNASILEDLDSLIKSSQTALLTALLNHFSNEEVVTQGLSALNSLVFDGSAIEKLLSISVRRRDGEICNALSGIKGVMIRHRQLSDVQAEGVGLVITLIDHVGCQGLWRASSLFPPLCSTPDEEPLSLSLSRLPPPRLLFPLLINLSFLRSTAHQKPRQRTWSPSTTSWTSRCCFRTR